MQREVPPDRDERLRAELRDLGYLENPLSRFFAGGLTGRRPALRTHVRVGIGAGSVLGSLAALLAVPLALAGPRRQSALEVLVPLVASFAVGLVVGLLAAAVMFAAYRLSRRLVDRAELVARITGVAAAALAFLYVVSFLRLYGAAWLAGLGVLGLPRAMLLALAAATFAYLVGRLFYLAAFAVLAALPGYAFAPRRTYARRALLTIAGLAAATAAAALALDSDASTAQFAAEGEAIERAAPLAARVVLIGIDGLDERSLEDALAAGWMPALAARRAHARLTPIEASAAAIPPAFWTTATTGLGVARHGLDAYYRPRVLGISQGLVERLERPGLLGSVIALFRILGLVEDAPVTGSTLRFPRLVDVAANAGLTTSSINFWATYPASAFAGAMVTERAHPVLREAAMRGTQIDPEIAAPDTLRAALPTHLHGEELAVDEIPSIAKHGLAGNRATIRPVLYDAFVHSVALSQLDDGPPDFMQIGLAGLDILRHGYRRRAGALSDPRLAAQGDVLRDYYLFVDRFLERVRLAAGQDALLAIVGYPGISAADPATRGFLWIEGPCVEVAPPSAPGAPAAELPLQPEDLAPTLAHALGLPGSGEQDGQARLAIFRPALRGTARRVRSYGLKPAREILDRSSEETLRHLAESGYL